MQLKLLALITVIGLVTVPGAQAQQTGGGELRGISTLNGALPRPVGVGRNTPHGQIVARGRLQRDGSCAFDTFGVVTTVAQGSRRIGLLYNTDCSVTVDEITDSPDLLEPNDPALAIATPGVFGRITAIAGRLWDALFPVAFAQAGTYYRTAYYDIWTCGVLCPPDGLTALQQWTDFHYRPYYEIWMDSYFGWWCVDGSRVDPNTGQRKSFCQPPMDIPNSPMFPEETHWYGYGGGVAELASGPSFIRFTGLKGYFHAPNGPSSWHEFDHTLYDRIEINNAGYASCYSWVTGSWVRGPQRTYANCAVYPRDIPL
jgi:hypothetical protein